MQNLVFTQLSTPELQQLFRGELEKFFAEHLLKESTKVDEIGGIELAIEITGKSKPTIYALTSTNSIPHSKRGKKLYFSRNELIDWLRQGKRKTQAELAADARNHNQNNKAKMPVG